MLYKIGDFSKKVNVSVRTLRYYDEIGILLPREIDLFTNYRYYSEEQIEDYKIIESLKEVGFSLDEIKKYWNNFNNEIMLNKRKELLNKIEIETNKIRKIDYLRSNIDKGKIIIKTEEENNKKLSLY